MQHGNAKLMNVKELCSMFRISATTLYRILREGPSGDDGLDLRKIPTRMIGRRRFFSRKHAEDLLNSFCDLPLLSSEDQGEYDGF